MTATTGATREAPARNRKQAARPAEVPPLRTAGPVAELPAGADRAGWVRSGPFGTDGARTWQLDNGEWRLLVDAHVRVLVERSAAPDPDFPDRAEDGDDATLEASSDVLITVERGGRRRSKTYRAVRTSNLRKLTPLDQFGPSAWKGADASANGRARLFRAIGDLSDAYGLPAVDFYAVTGWHPTPDGRGEMFVHGGGVIGPAGELTEVEVRAGDQLGALRLGEPAAGPALVEALAEVMALVDSGALPGRVLAPLLASALRPLFGVYRDPAGPAAEVEFGANAWVSGGTGGGKSGATAAAINAAYPGLTYNRFPFKAGSSKNGGATGPGLERLAFRARDLLLPFDDLDPSEPDAVRAAWQSNLLRSAFGQYGRLLAQRGGSDNRQAMPWRAGVVGTGEPLDAEASAENRVANVPIGAGDIRIAELRTRTGVAERTVRGRLGAGLVRALAADRAGHRERLDQARSGLRPLFVAGEAPGPVARGADTLAEMAATLRVMLSILVDQGMSRADARRCWRTLRAGLVEAWRVHLAVIGSGDRASRAVGYLRQALDSGLIRLDDKAHPGQPSRDMHGWETRAGNQFGPSDPRPAALIVGGWQDSETGDLLLLPAVATGAVRRVAEGAGDSWTGSTKTVAEALKAGGYLHVPERSARDGEAAMRARIGGQLKRVWHLHADRFDGEAGPSYGGTDYSGPVDPAGLPCGWLDNDQAASVPGCVPGSTDALTCDVPGTVPGSISALTCDVPGVPGKSEVTPIGGSTGTVPGSAERAAAVRGCPECSVPGQWCGRGFTWPGVSPCAICETPTRYTARCGIFLCQACTGYAGPVVTVDLVPLPCERCGSQTRTRVDGRPLHRSDAACVHRPPAQMAVAAPAASDRRNGRADESTALRPTERVSRGRRLPAVPAGPVEVTPDGPSIETQAADLVRALGKVGRQVDQVTAVAVLAEWHAATGGLQFRDWFGDTGISAYAWLRARAGNDRRGIAGAERIDSPAAEAASRDAVLHLDYTARDQVPVLGQCVTELDANGQFLSSSGIELGHGDPLVIDSPHSIAGYLQVPGYLRLARDLRVTVAELPHTWQAFTGIRAGRTLATTTARYLVDRGVELDVSEAIVWPEGQHRRHLAAWYALFREARKTLLGRAGVDQRGEPAELALLVLKMVCSVTLGGWIRSDRNRSDFMRRDWSDQIISESWIRALLAIERAGAAGFPSMGMRRDSAWFLGSSAPIVPTDINAGAKTLGSAQGSRPSTQLGKWKVSRYAEVDASIIDAHRGGSAEVLNSSIKAAHEAREGQR